MSIKVGDNIPISLQLVDGNVSRYPIAKIYNSSFTLLNTVNLNSVGNGLYSPSTPEVMPNSQFVTVQYITYTDSGHTTLDPINGLVSEIIEADSGYIAPSQIEVKRGVALADFTFPMYASTNQHPLSGLTVTATRSIDGGAFGACANAVSEIGNGWYKINLAGTDLDGLVVALNFSATLADDTQITLITQE
jgi:hypothetical protein